MRKLIAVFWVLFTICFAFSQPNTTCQNAAPFCTGTTYNFPAGVNAGSAQNGPYYDCLFTQPNPVWYYMQVAQSGPITIVMQGSGNMDIDFCCWGPFNSLNGVCNNLTANNVVDCSYSTSATETCVIPNAVAGQYYILLITNFSNQPQNIIFSQSNANQPGAGSTNCAILCSMTVTGTSSLCAGQNATLSAIPGNGVTSINWIGPNGFNSNNNPNPSITNVQTTGVYTAIATTTASAPGNTCALTHTVTVNPPPALIASNGGPYCVGQNAQLNLTGGTSYTWSGPGGFSSNQQNPTINNVQINASGTYTVIAASAQGCTAQATTQLSVNNNPTVILSSSGNFCEGQSFQITATGATNYTWSGPGGFNANGSSVSFQNNNLNMSGTYTVIGANGACTSINTIPVTIHPLPQIQLSSNSPVCQSQVLTLNSSGNAQNYIWLGPNNFSYIGQVLNINSSHPTNSGTYTLIAISSQGCSVAPTIPVTVHPTPVLSIVSSNRCVNETITFQVQGNFNPSGTFSWTGPNGFQSNVQNPVIPNAQVTNSGNYTLIYTTPSGCTVQSQVWINVFPLPNVQISGNTAACYGKSITLNGSGALYYKWLAPWGEIAQGPQLVVSTSSPTYTQIYTLVGMDNNGCTNTATIETIVHPLPQALIYSSKPGGCVPFCMEFTFGSAPQNLTEFAWSFSDGTTLNQQSSADVCMQNAGTYTMSLFLKDANGCSNTVQRVIEAYPKPYANFSQNPGNPTFLYPEVQFYDESGGANIVKWEWDFMSNGQYKDSIKNPIFNFKEMGQYITSLIVTSDKGCKDTTFKTVIVGDEFGIYIPNAFSPNGDGFNDVFVPKGHGINKFEMFIYDRWGNIVFHSREFGKGWDGKIKGADATNDVYVYLVKVKDLNGKNREFKGHVTLLR
ncbi:MAG: gliding motility-associated C-terminal domain-containing protein [Bacteroidia bacterium]|nr:gliding motility-associated C-terminal domain-containing protein [Bacteroidia bacterium]